MASKLDRHAEELGALGHPVRLAILRFVVQSGDARLMKSRSEGTFHYYSADYTALRALTDYLWEDCCKRGKSGCC